ncbi:hypothetical protein LCGC14_1163980 [marine sediment metagenome]|uniref:Uncharacterized protein n=1 Tax=marine sediment metagenome TaxID=412755 RepID=A0A0F9PXE3_9ZZZZ
MIEAMLIIIMTPLIYIIYNIIAKKLRKYWRLYKRLCKNCGYSRDDIDRKWEICGIDKKYIGYIRCQECCTCQLDWKKK